MTSAEFNAVRRTIDLTDDQLAAQLDVPLAMMRAWASGREQVPQRHAKQLVWHAAVAEREATLRARGLAECPWVIAHMSDVDMSNAEHLKSLETHAATCDLCLARTRAMEELGPLPPYPHSGFMRVFEWTDRIPAWARPAVFGFVFLAAIVSLRVVFAFPALFREPGQLAEALLAVGAAGGAGAAGGFAYSIIRPYLRHRGIAGAYLTGIVCVVAYLGALVLMAPVVFGEPLIEDIAGLVVFLVLAIIFGIVFGHAAFRDSE